MARQRDIIKSVAKSILTPRFDRAIVRRVDGDRVDVVTIRSSNAIRNVRVGGNVGQLNVGDRVTIVWSDERPVVIYGDTFTYNEAAVTEQITFPEKPAEYVTGEGIKLYHSSGQVDIYPVTEDGLEEALASADIDSVVFVPAAQLSGDFEVPGGTTLKGIDKRATVIQGVITATGGAKLRGLTVLCYQDTSSDIYAVIGPDDTDLTIQDCLIQVSNCGSGDSIAIQMNDGNINIENTKLSCASVGGTTHIIECAGGGIATLLDCPLSSAGIYYTDDTKVSVYGTSVTSSDLAGYCNPGYTLNLVQNVSRFNNRPLYENGFVGHVSSTSLEHRIITGLTSRDKPLSNSSYVIFANLDTFNTAHSMYVGDKVSRYNINTDTIEEISFTGKTVWDVVLVDSDICYALVSNDGSSCDIYKLDFSNMSALSIWSGSYIYQSLYINELDNDYLLAYGFANPYTDYNLYFGGYKISTDTMSETSVHYFHTALCGVIKPSAYVAGTFGTVALLMGRWRDNCPPDLGGQFASDYWANYDFSNNTAAVDATITSENHDYVRDDTNSVVLVRGTTMYTVTPATLAKATITGLGTVSHLFIGSDDIYYSNIVDYSSYNIYKYSTKVLMGTLAYNSGYLPARYLDDEDYINVAKDVSRNVLKRVLISNFSTTEEISITYSFGLLDIRGEGLIHLDGVFI